MIIMEFIGPITFNTEEALRIMFFMEKGLKKQKIIFSKVFTVMEKK